LYKQLLGLAVVFQANLKNILINPFADTSFVVYSAQINNDDTFFQDYLTLLCCFRAVVAVKVTLLYTAGKSPSL